MFANALRTQTRLAPSVRRTVSFTRNFTALVPRATLAPKVSRLLSTTPRRLEENVSKDNFFAKHRDPARIYPPNTHVYVGNLPFYVTAQEINTLFGEYGPTKPPVMGLAPDGRSLGWALVRFENLDDALAAVNSAIEEPFHLAGRDLNVAFANPSPSPKRDVVPNKKIYFSHFEEPSLTTLEKFLGPHAKLVTDAFFLRDKVSREPMSAGFIEFQTVEDATKALEDLHGITGPSGKPVQLTYARRRESGNQAGGQTGNDN